MSAITTNHPIEALELSVRLTNILRAEHIFTVAELVRRFPGFVRKLPGIGKRSLNEIEIALAGVQHTTVTAPKDNGGPAFPLVAETHQHVIATGLDMRDYFAAKALPALIAGRNWSHLEGGDEALIAQWARSSYALADAMLAARQGSAA